MQVRWNPYYVLWWEHPLTPPHFLQGVELLTQKTQKYRRKCKFSAASLGIMRRGMPANLRPPLGSRIHAHSPIFDPFVQCMLHPRHYHPSSTSVIPERAPQLSLCHFFILQEQVLLSILAIGAFTSST